MIKAILLGVLLSACTDPVLQDHHDPRSYQGYAHMEEGCYEVFTDSPGYSQYPSTCVSDTGFKCVFAVQLSDGSVGCCSEDEGQAGTVGDSSAYWNSCPGY